MDSINSKPKVELLTKNLHEKRVGQKEREEKMVLPQEMRYSALQEGVAS